MSHNQPTKEQILISTSQSLDDAVDDSGVWIGNSDITQNPQTTAYTLALTDRGKHISTNSNITIPANSSVAFPVGSAISIFNSNTANITISITTDTLVLAATSNTGTMNLQSNGIATVLKVGGTKWVGAGVGFGV